MAVRPKIPSNETNLAIAKESSTLGALPGSPIWYRLWPTGYPNDFGADYVRRAQEPIHPSQERYKGENVDRNIKAGYTADFSPASHFPIFDGLLYCAPSNYSIVTVDSIASNVISVTGSTSGFAVGDIIVLENMTDPANERLALIIASIVANTSITVISGATDETSPANATASLAGHQFSVGDVEVDASGDLPVLISGGTAFNTLGLTPGQWIYLGGDVATSFFSTGANNGFKRIRRLVANDTIELDKSVASMVTESGAAVALSVFYGPVFKNEQQADQVRSTYQIERNLSYINTSNPTDWQAEVVKGAVVDEFKVNINANDAITVDTTFVAIDAENIEAGDTLPTESGTVVELELNRFYNASYDVKRMMLAPCSDTAETPTSVFGYVMSGDITVNNQHSVNKAVGVFGGFDITRGTLMVSGNLDVYFVTVAAKDAIKNNLDYTLDMIFAKENRGIAFDMPLVGLGDGKVAVELNQAMKIPVTFDATNGYRANANLDHTLLISVFPYLPDAAL